MSKYTTELRFICEELAGLNESVGNDKVEEVLEAARPKIFNFSYPIYDENHRKELEMKILRHFYTREIGMETYGLWHMRLKTKIIEIMPFYNQLFKSISDNFNYFWDTDYSRKIDETKTYNSNVKDTHGGNDIASKSGENTTTSHSTTNGEGSSNQTTKFSDTPQGGLTGLENDEYLTNATMVGNESNASDETNGSVSEHFGESTTTTYGHTIQRENSGNDSNETGERVSGKRGGKSYAELMMEFKKEIIDIDLMIIGNLEELFMQIW